jgi:predicted nucleic-acid-binding protein
MVFEAVPEFIALRAGLVILNAGGDFADGEIAPGGRALGTEKLVTFDREAARLLSEADEPVLLL